MTLQPQKDFVITRQIANHLDTDTLYVQAVIRDAVTDTILETVNLDDKGSQRFTKSWHTVADPSGQGRNISIVTSVYTDSNYTTKSPNYGDEENTHLIQERVLGSLKSGGGLDMATTRRIFAEELAKLTLPNLQDIQFPAQKDYDVMFKQVAIQIQEIKDSIALLIIDQLERIAQSIEKKPVTPPTDLKPVLSLLLSNAKESGKEKEINQQEIKEMIAKLEKMLPEVTLKSVKEAIKKGSFLVPMNIVEPKEEKKVFNTKRLAI